MTIDTIKKPDDLLGSIVAQDKDAAMIEFDGEAAWIYSSIKKSPYTDELKGKDFADAKTKLGFVEDYSPGHIYMWIDENEEQCYICFAEDYEL